jgi:hypothetical protein
MPNLDYKTIRKELLRREANEMHSKFILDSSIEPTYNPKFKKMIQSIVKDKNGKSNLIIVRSEDENVKTLLDGMFVTLIGQIGDIAVELASTGTFVALFDRNKYGVCRLIQFPQNEIYFIKDSSGLGHQFPGFYDHWFWNGPGTKVDNSDLVCCFNYILGDDSFLANRPYGDSVFYTEYNLLSERVKIRTAIERVLYESAKTHLSILFGSREPLPHFEVFLDTPEIENGSIVVQPDSGKIRNFDGSEFDLKLSGPRNYEIEEQDKTGFMTKLQNSKALLQELGLLEKDSEEDGLKETEKEN